MHPAAGRLYLERKSRPSGLLRRSGILPCTLRFQTGGRREFDRLKASDPRTLTELERAARFLYLQRLAFGGKVNGRNFGVDPGRSSRFNINQIEPLLADIHERLSGVVIECLPWADFIVRYDRTETLFYLDPPYFGNETDYGADMFGRDQFALMADVLSRLKGQFILSINDRPEVREIFGQFKLQPVELTYSVAGGSNAKTAAELIIMR